MDFDRIDDEKLVDLVESNECLYNKFHKYYKLVEAKDQAWIKIGKELGASAEQCAKRWTLLRERFGKECKKRDANQSNFGRKWPLFERLLFLKKHIIPRPHRSNPNTTLEATVMCSTSHSSSDPLDSSPSPIPSKKRKIDIDEAFMTALDLFCEELKERRARSGNEAVLSFTSMISAKLSAMSPERQSRMMFRIHELLIDEEENVL